MDPSHVRPNTRLSKDLNPQTILQNRNQYIRDATGQITLVMLEGIPHQTSLGSITYVMLTSFKDEKFDWAYEWVNRPGIGEKFEPNAIPIANGYFWLLPAMLIVTGNGQGKLHGQDDGHSC